MKKTAILLFFFLVSCAPQVTVTSEVTVTSLPPTATAMPMPTLHPQFVVLQEQVAASGERFTLMPDGTIQDGAIPISGLNVDKNGVMTLQVDDQIVELSFEDLSFGDNGIEVKGYTFNKETGEWQPALTPEQQAIKALPAELQLLIADGASFDTEKGVAWNQDGLVTWAKDAKGEWINYPGGNVPIPPGPGYENEPPLMVPYYHSFNEAIKAITSQLPWGQLRETFRAKQDAANKLSANTYWMPILLNGTWETSFFGSLNLHVSADPTLEADVFVSDMQLPGGSIQMRLDYQSIATDHYHTSILIFGNPNETYNELRRIDECVKADRMATDLAKLCASETIEIPAPAK